MGQLGHPVPKPGEMLDIVFGSGLADPLVSVGRVIANELPRVQHTIPRRRGLCAHRHKRNILHRLVEPLVHGVDVEILGPVRADVHTLEGNP